MDTLDHDHAVAASPTRFDFLFVKPGARWQNLRQQTIWDRGLLGRLAMEYGNQASDFDKRSLVERFVVLVVSKGGRFLRSHDEKKNIAWVVVRDKNAIVRDLMRVLRQMKKRINHEERQIVNELKEMTQTLQELQASISKIHGRVREHLHTHAGQTGTQRTNGMTYAGNLSLKEARRIRMLLVGMDKTASDSFETLNL